MPCRVSSHVEKEIVNSLNCLNVFKPNEHTEDYHIKKTDDEKLLFESEDRNLRWR